MLEGLEEDVSISFSEKPDEIEAEPECLKWQEFNLEVSREVCYETVPK
jgi:hypothetical protein